MGLFKVNQPRGFQHNYIYYDPRKEKIQKIEERAKRELGLLPGKSTCLDIFIETLPCHIASLPVAVNIQCHANRVEKIEL